MEIEQLAMFNFDISIVTILLLTALFWKEQQVILIVGSFIYLFFVIVWHFPPGLLVY